MKMDFFFFEKYNDFPVFLQSCEQKIILRVLSNPLFLKIIFYFIWYIVGITNLYSLSTFVYASLVFSRLITENPVQRKSIWQPIPDFVIIWFLGKKTPAWSDHSNGNKMTEHIPNVMNMYYSIQQKGRIILYTRINSLCIYTWIHVHAW